LGRLGDIIILKTIKPILVLLAFSSKVPTFQIAVTHYTMILSKRVFNSDFKSGWIEMPVLKYLDHHVWGMSKMYVPLRSRLGQMVSNVSTSICEMHSFIQG
jgi:hypothetical protein